MSAIPLPNGREASSVYHNRHSNSHSLKIASAEPSGYSSVASSHILYRESRCTASPKPAQLRGETRLFVHMNTILMACNLGKLRRPTKQLVLIWSCEQCSQDEGISRQTCPHRYQPVQQQTNTLPHHHKPTDSSYPQHAPKHRNNYCLGRFG